MRLTRQQITTSFGQPANLGCYTNHTNSSSLKYSWTKDNVNVTPSSNINVYDNVLVVTPENNSDFGTYECHVSNGVTTTSCSISLQPGCNKTGEELDMYFVLVLNLCHSFRLEKLASIGFIRGPVFRMVFLV